MRSSCFFAIFIFTLNSVVSYALDDTYIVKHGDNLHKIAQNNGVSIMKILKHNQDLEYSKDLKVGQKIIIPKVDKKEIEKKVISDTIIEKKVDNKITTNIYIVKANETLYGISNRTGIPSNIIKDLNNITDSNSIKVGQELILPKTEEKISEKSEIKTEIKQENIKNDISIIENTNVNKDIKDLTKEIKIEKQNDPIKNENKFMWPVKGKIILPYGSKKNGKESDGVVINVEENMSVRASATGKVVFRGNAINDLGNILMIEHYNGYITTYGMLSNIIVDNLTTVKKGQIIAYVEKNSKSILPQLYFSIAREGVFYNPSNMIK